MDKPNPYKPYIEGDAVELICWADKKNKVSSELTGRIAIILKNYDPDVMFFKTEPEYGPYSFVQWNNAIAKDLWYKVMIGKNIIECNHLCFIDTSGWKIASLGERHNVRF